MRLHRVAAAVALVGLSACGGAHVGDENQDASIDGEGLPADMSGDDGPRPLACDYTEAADGTNSMVSTAEATGKSVGSRLTICGKIDNGHFDATYELVDGDGFSFDVASDTDVLVHVLGSGVTAPQRTTISLVQAGSPFAFGVVEGDHGTLSAHLAAGTYVATVAGFKSTDLAAPGDYQLTIVPDTLAATRCQKLSSAAKYVEHLDGASDNGNDMIDYNSTSNTPSTFSATTADSPEPTGITLATGTLEHVRITGLSANVDPPDDYEDRDTFELTTGPTTTQMSIRLNWGSTTMDLDYRVYPISSTKPLSIAGGLDESLSEEEFETFAVKPNTTYWVWVAAEDGATGQPSAYDATLCGDTFSP